MAILSNNQHIGKYEVTRLIKENNISKDEGLVFRHGEINAGEDA